MLRDTRAQGGAVGILNFFLALGVGAICSMLVTTVTDPLLEYSANNTNSTVAAQTRGWFGEFITNQPLIFLLTAFFALIALSVFQRAVR